MFLILSPCWQLEVVDYSTIGEILLKAIGEANQFFQMNHLPHRFNNDVSALVDDVYDVYMAKKDNGKPKDDYPNFEMKMTVKTAKVKQNRFSVVFSEKALLPVSSKQGAGVEVVVAAKAVVEKNEQSILETRASSSSPMS